MIVLFVGGERWWRVHAGDRVGQSGQPGKGVVVPIGDLP